MLNMKCVKISMIKKEMTAIEIAKKLKCNVNTISRWINNNNLGQIELFINLLLLLEIDLKELKELKEL